MLNTNPVYIQKLPRDKDNTYGQVSHKILYNNNTLSCTDKGFLSIILAMDSSKPITIRALKDVCKEHPDTIRNYLERLEKLKFVTKKELITNHGYFPEYQYFINEFAVMELTNRSSKKITDRTDRQVTDPSHRLLSYGTVRKVTHVLKDKELNNPKKEDNKPPLTPPLTETKLVEQKSEVVNFYSQEQKELGKKLVNLNPGKEDWKAKVKILINDYDLKIVTDWYQALEFYPADVKSKTWYLFDSITTKRSLPDDYKRQKNDRVRKQLYSDWSDLVLALKMPPPATSNIENRVADIITMLVARLETVSNYNSGDIDYKDKNNQLCRFALNDLKIFLSLKTIKELSEITKDYLNSSDKKQMTAGLMQIKRETSSILGMVQMIPNYLETLDSLV